MDISPGCERVAYRDAYILAVNKRSLGRFLIYKTLLYIRLYKKHNLPIITEVKVYIFLKR